MVIVGRKIRKIVFWVWGSGIYRFEKVFIG